MALSPRSAVVADSQVGACAVLPVFPDCIKVPLDLHRLCRIECEQRPAARCSCACTDHHEIATVVAVIHQNVASRLVAEQLAVVQCAHLPMLLRGCPVKVFPVCTWSYGVDLWH